MGSGSDVASIRTRARKDGGDSIVGGGKMWTPNGTQADGCCVLADTSDGAVHRKKRHHRCLQFWCGMGFMDESLISRLYRDMRLPSIGGGADEVMLQILSRTMGAAPAPAR